MITSNVLRRTFHIRWGDGSGTAFAIDRNGRQYLVTARHVVKGINPGNQIAIFHEKQWKSVSVDVIGIGEHAIDVAVLSCPIRLVPPLPLEASAGGLGFGQPIYFLGFPFGWDSGSENMNQNFPLPFVKAGIVSAITFGDTSLIYIDGHNNKGFSGGPVVFVPAGRPQDEFQVAGIVVSYPTPIREPVVDKSGFPIVDARNEPVAYFPENPGFVVALSINHATNLIDSNPVGFQLLDN